MQAQGARRTRGKWSEDEKRGYVGRWEASGLAAREFGKREGVRPENLYRWQRETAPAPQPPRPSVTFAPVKVTAADEPQRPVELASGLALEVELPSGVRVRVYRGADMRAANELLSALFGRRAC